MHTPYITWGSISYLGILVIKTKQALIGGWVECKNQGMTLKIPLGVPTFLCIALYLCYLPGETYTAEVKV